MFASSLLSRLTSTNDSPPLLPVSETPRNPYTDIIPPSPTDTSATLLALARQEAHLQSHIQFLLDVQSERLLEGLGEPARVDTTTAPNGAFPQQASPGGRRKEKPSLHGTRQGIRDAITTLHDLKTQSADILSSELDVASQNLSSVTNLQAKKQSLQSTIQDLEVSPTSTAITAQEKELADLDKRIYEVENQLFEMKARQRVLRQKIDEGRNKEEARRSSWKRSLEIVQEEEKQLLARKSPSSSSPSGPRGGNGNSEAASPTVWDLPPPRRTLEMVSEYYASEQKELGEKLEGIETERHALEDGGKVWGNVVRDVGRVERLLEHEMTAPRRARPRVEITDSVMRVLDTMDAVRDSCTTHLAEAEEKGWKLLVVCIGAELEALRQGEMVLRNMLEEALGHGEVGLVGDGEGSGDSVHDVTEDCLEPTNHLTDRTDDDGEPGPHLLVSR
ncbi:MAG: hypothetical protein Q9201_003597 [Fulgogasparrea decipioides]